MKTQQQISFSRIVVQQQKKKNLFTGILEALGKQAKNAAFWRSMDN